MNDLGEIQQVQTAIEPPTEMRITNLRKSLFADNVEPKQRSKQMRLGASLYEEASQGRKVELQTTNLVTRL